MKKSLFIFIVVFLTIPLGVGVFSLVKEKPLDGAFAGEKIYTLKYFTWSRWFDDRFQEAMVKKSAQKTGFRNTLIRVANHLDFLLLRHLHAYKAVLGKDNYLFEEGYIVDYLGRNYMGERFIRENLHQFKMAQEVLQRNYNIKLILVLEPGKAGIYPEKIPMQYQPSQRSISNYQTYQRLSEEMKIPCLNLQSYFLALKDTSKYPLYPKYGVHWSTYGMWLASDTLLKFIQKTADINLPQINWHGITTTNKLKDVDFDLEKTINLLTELPHQTLAYPQISFDTANKTKPRVLTIADSYYWSIFDNKIPQNAFQNADFWYYNTTIYPKIWGDNAKLVKDLNVMNEIKSNQIILFMITEMNLYKAFWGFTDTILKHELPNYRIPNWFLIAQKLVNNDLYYKKMLLYCSNYHQSFDAVLNYLTTFIANAIQNPSHFCYRNFWITRAENQIYTNPEWLKKCKEKAKTNNITVQKAVYLDALWQYTNDLNKKVLIFN